MFGMLVLLAVNHPIGTPIPLGVIETQCECEHFASQTPLLLQEAFARGSLLPIGVRYSIVTIHNVSGEVLMSAQALLIQWTESKEVLVVDMDALRRGHSIRTTTETWGPRPSYIYHTTSKFVPDPQGNGTLSIYYAKKDNKHLPNFNLEDYRWGHTVLELNKALTGGKVTWHDNNDVVDAQSGKPYYSGETFWRRFSNKDAIVSESELKSISVKARKQAKFRKRLLAIDPQCAITGERAQVLLDAAHVIPKSKGGAEVDVNGIMLRVDLHRLFDSEVFTIRNDGKIVVEKKSCPEHYRKLLAGRELRQDTLSRILVALKFLGK